MKEKLIITVPNPILSEVTQSVASFDSDFKKQIDLMVKTLRCQDGVGLASNQLGFGNSVFVVEFQTKDGKNNIPLQIFVNPQIIQYGDTNIEMNEGCLSVPKIELPLTRPEKIKIKAQDENGKKIKLSATGLLSRIIQHESDHLHGKIFTQLAKEKLHKENPEIKNLKIVFIGTGNFAEMIQRTLILLDLNIKLIITETGKPSGRDKKVCQSLVGQTANIFNKKLLEVNKINESLSILKEIKPDLIILADFGQLVPEAILDIPKIMAINVHPSLLPKFRGSTPIQSAILEGAKETGVSIIKMSPKIDEGDLIFQESVEISDDDNALSMRDLLANLSSKMLLELLPKIQTGHFNVIKQNNNIATNTKKINKTDGEINWNDKIEIIDRQIRAYLGWPGSYTNIDNKRLIIHQAHLDNKKLVLDIVQLEGKNVTTWQDFLHGYKGPKPDWFSKIDLKK